MPARVECFAGFVFVAIDPDIAPLRDGLGRARGAPRAVRPRAPRALHRATSAQPANWKIVADNYLEGYHVPIAHPGLMRLLDYQHYDVEVFDGYVFFEAPLREKPSGNRLERAYQRLVRPIPGSGPRTGASGATSTSTRTRRSTSTRPGHDVADQPDGSTPRTTSTRATASRAPERRDARHCSGSTTGSTTTSRTRTPSWSGASRPGWRRAAGRPARSASARRRSPGSRMRPARPRERAG